MKVLVFLVAMLATGVVKADQKDYYVMKFGAKWCSPCQDMERYVWPNKKIKNEIKKFKNGKLYKFDSDKKSDRHVFIQYAVTNIPTVLIVDKDGTVVKRAVGYMNTDDLYDFLHNNVGKRIQAGKHPYAIHNEDVYVFPAVITLRWVVIAIAKLLLFLIG